MENLPGYSKKFKFAIDRGGTFTDIYAETPKGYKVLKLLSVDKAYKDAPREGIRRILEVKNPFKLPFKHINLKLLKNKKRWSQETK